MTHLTERPVMALAWKVRQKIFTVRLRSDGSIIKIWKRREPPVGTPQAHPSPQRPQTSNLSMAVVAQAHPFRYFSFSSLFFVKDLPPPVLNFNLFFFSGKFCYLIDLFSIFLLFTHLNFNYFSNLILSKVGNKCSVVTIE